MSPILAMLFSLLGPLFANLPCLKPPTPTGKLPDPHELLKSHLMPDGVSFKPEFLARQQRTTMRAVRINNRNLGTRRRKHRNDPSFIDPKTVDLDAVTTEYFLKVLATPKAAVMAGFKAGLESRLSDD